MAQIQSNQNNLISRASLPTATQHWLDKALPQNLDFPSSIRIEQEGSMDIRGRWTSFKAIGIYKASPLSFNWKARLQMLPGVWIVAEDGHLGGQGWGGARLWGIISMGKSTDSEVLVSQLVRNLGELALLPSFALTDPTLRWADAGENAFEVRSSAEGQEVMVRFDINDKGDVYRAYSPSRPFDVPDGFAEAPWHYEFSDHRGISGVRIPTIAVARFEKEDGLYEYMRWRVTSITFE